MFNIKKWIAIAVTAAAMLASGMFFAPAAPANAAPLGACTPNTTYDVTLSNVVTNPIITHLSDKYSAGGTDLTVTRTATFKRTVSASVSGTLTGSVNTSVIMAKVSATASITAAASGSVTTTSSESLTATVQKNTTGFFFDGRVTVSASWQARQCSSSGSVTTISGYVTSFNTIAVKGYQSCNSNANEAVSQQVKKQFC